VKDDKNHPNPRLPRSPLEEQARRVLLVHRALLAGAASALLTEAAVAALRMAEAEAKARLTAVGLPAAVPGERAMAIRAAEIMAKAAAVTLAKAAATPATEKETNK
jgi:hypothetical protein